MAYLNRGFLDFRLNDQCYCYNRGIVCDNVSILCTHVYHGMVNNVAGGSFPFCRTEKPFFIFRVQKRGVLWQQPPNESFKMIIPHFLKILDHIEWTIPQPGYLKPFRSPLVQKTNSGRVG